MSKSKKIFFIELNDWISDCEKELSKIKHSSTRRKRLASMRRMRHSVADSKSMALIDSMEHYGINPKKFIHTIRIVSDKSFIRDQDILYAIKLLSFYKQIIERYVSLDLSNIISA